MALRSACKLTIYSTMAARALLSSCNGVLSNFEHLSNQFKAYSGKSLLYSYRARFTNSVRQHKPSFGIKIVLSGFTKDAQ